jgi:AcrR family transcriptional regulator
MAARASPTGRRPRRPAPPARRDGESKSDATRRMLLERAHRLFQQRGVDATTMRDIAKAAGLSLGAAYYYFPSKQAMLFAFYEDNQARFEALGARLGRAGDDPPAEGRPPQPGTVRARLGALMHGQLESIAAHRSMLISIIHHLVDPADPLSAFSQQNRAVRARAIAVYTGALDGAGLPPPALAVAAHALWLLVLACMLVYVHDDSPGGARTHGLVDDGLDLLVPLLPFLGTPPGVALCARALAALERAGISLAARADR